MIIRRMQEADISFVSALENEIFPDPWSEDSFLTEIKRENNIYLVAEDNGEIYGYCGLWGIVGEGQITNVAVHKDKRNQGIAKSMLQQLLLLGRKQELTSFTLEVRESNFPAIHLYQELGFHSVGIRKDFYTHPRENAIIMWL